MATMDCKSLEDNSKRGNSETVIKELQQPSHETLLEESRNSPDISITGQAISTTVTNLTENLEHAFAEFKASETLPNYSSKVLPITSHVQANTPATPDETPVDKPESEDEPQSSSIQLYSSEQTVCAVETTPGDSEVNPVVREQFVFVPLQEPYVADIPSFQNLTRRRDYVLKIILIGKSGVGKTTIIRRYTGQHFLQSYRSTLGVDFYNKKTDTQYGCVSLRIHDFAGEDRIPLLSRAFYKKSHGVMICYDVTDERSIASVSDLTAAVDGIVCAEDGSNLPRVLVGNKCDLRTEIKHSRDDMVNFAKQHKCGAWYEVSAKTGQNINEAFSTLVNIMVAMNSEEEAEILNV